MKIQKGMVKYKDRNDIVCIYGVTDDGKTYYFLNNDGKSFSNGNYIASTELVEAIDPMYKASKIGVVNSEGKEVIPCENKGVKVITDDVILVEKAVPITDTVLQAIERRSDSLYAAQLVSTPAQIKDSIYHEMGNDGRFLFNDQFAEATVYDIDGNNLINGDVYSFIAINNNNLYLSKNVPGSPVVHFDLSENKVQEAVQEDAAPVPMPPGVPIDSTVQAYDNEHIDVNNVNVPMEVVENALEGVDTAGTEHNVIQDNFEVDTHTPIENVNEGLELPSSADFMAATNVGIPVVHEDNANSVIEGLAKLDDDSSTVNDGVPNIDDVQEHVDEEMNLNTVDEVSENTAVENVADEVVSDTEEHSEEVVPSVDDVIDKVNNENATEDVAQEVEAVVEEEKTDVADTLEEVSLNIAGDVTDESFDELVDEKTDVVEEEKEVPLKEKEIQSLLDETSTDLFGGSSLRLDSILSGSVYDDLDRYSISIPETSKSDTIYDDIANSMADLMKQVKEQRATLANYEEVINGLNTDKAELQEKLSTLERQNVELSDRNRTFENGVIKLKTRNELLLTKLHDKDKVIATQEAELKDLRKQVAGRDKLIRLIRDARALVSDSSITDDVDDYSYMKAA